MAKREQIAGGELCPKCGRRMQRYQHPPGWKPKEGQPFYFRYWDICHQRHSPGKKRSDHFQGYEVAKVIVSPILQDAADRRRHFRSL
jgi:hypothetical protein